MAWLWAGPAPVQAAPGGDRGLIVDAMEYPWSALGRLNVGGRSHCTGVLISDRHVLSKASCLYNQTEGRWWHASELHFVAGYQRDSYQIHSPVAHYAIAPGYGNGKTLADLINDWSVVTLAYGIGHRAGWMALQWMRDPVRNRLETGRAYVLRAGYSAGQPHVITITLDCSVHGWARRILIERGACPKRRAGVAGLSKLLFIDGEFRALAPRRMTPSFLGALLVGRSPADARAPSTDGPASRLPRNTVFALLHQMGYAKDANGNGVATAVHGAISAFQEDRDLPATGKVSMGLLGRLITARYLESVPRSDAPLAVDSDLLATAPD